MNTDIMMELKKMMGKVIKLTTTEDKKGQSQVMVFTIGANVAPEQFFANMRITPIVKSYEVTNPMPLLDAVEFASKLMRQKISHRRKVRFMGHCLQYNKVTRLREKQP